MKYRKKPPIVEAIQYHEEMRKNDCLPDGVYIIPTSEGDMPVIHTLDGYKIVREGDYIITGVNEENYICKPDIFEKTHEKIEG